MASSVGEIEVKLTLNAEDFQRMMGQSKQNLNEFSGATQSFMSELTKIFSFVAIADFFKKSLDAYGQQEVAIAKLTRALENHGNASDATVGHLQAMALQFEKLTGVEETNITTAQALLTNFGLTGDQLDKTTKAALDLSAGLGIDLESAARLMGKAFEGHTNTLARFGLQVSKTTDPTKRFADVLSEVNTKFGGSASAQINTFSGQMKLLGDSFQHLEEEIGKLIAGEAGGLVGWMKSMIENITKGVAFLNEIREATGSFISLIEGGLIVAAQAVIGHMFNIYATLINILSHIPLIGTAIAGLKPQIDLARIALNAMNQATRDTFVESTKSANGTIDNEHKKQAEYHNTYTTYVALLEQTSTMTKDKMAEEQKLREKNAADRKQAEMDFYKFFITTEADMWNEGTQLAQTFTQGVGDGFAKMIVEGKNFSDAMAALFQDMAEQIISYIVQMIVKMLILLALETATGVGPAGGAAIGGISGAMADGGMISEPSIITGLRSGRQILAGEAGPEMVMPMGGGGSNQTASEMGGLPGSGGGGGSITINIQGQFIDGDSNSWQKLMREKIIPEIRRFTMSSPTGPFNRTRGVV